MADDCPVICICFSSWEVQEEYVHKLNAWGSTGEMAASLLESLSIYVDIFLLFCLNAIPSAVLTETEQALSTEDPWSWLDT